jgi:HEPN domain-containing protein
MARKRFAPNDPREWMRRANLNLDRSLNIPPNADYEDFCFDAQQAAEKAVKAVFIHRAVPFPYTHNLGQLLKGLAIAGVRVPKYLLPANRLTRYAAETRYPGTFKPVTKVQYQRAVRMARRVLGWAERQIK